MYSRTGTDAQASYREANPDRCSERACLERALVELDEERRLAHATVADQDSLKHKNHMSQERR